MAQNIEKNDEIILVEQTEKIREISTVRRLMPQIIVAAIKNLIVLKKGCFYNLVPIIIPSLLGISNGLNPGETIRITANEASWLSTFTNIGDPFASSLSGFISDKLGRRLALIVSVALAALALILLAFADSFALICLAFLSLSFVFGLNNSPAMVYITEVSEPSVRGTLLTLAAIASAAGAFLVSLLGSYLSWRQVSLVISIIPVIIVISVFFIPETPNWLLSKNRPKDAQRALQWLRGWVSADAVRDEFKCLEKHRASLNACVSCAKQSLKCYHSQVTFCDKMVELKRKRTLKPLILVNCLFIILEFSASAVLKPYTIQVVKAYGMPLDANLTLTILSLMNLAGSCCLLATVKMIGKRRIYLCSVAALVCCSIGLSAYGFISFPSNWTSFKNPLDPTIPDFELARKLVGNYGYLALALLFAMEFFANFGPGSISMFITMEIFSFKLRSLLCGMSLAIRSIFSSIATKTYYNMEIWLTLPGAILFYGIISLIGLIGMYFILPETEGRSLEDIELHYADDTKKITDIHICMNGKSNEVYECNTRSDAIFAHAPLE